MSGRSTSAQGRRGPWLCRQWLVELARVRWALGVLALGLLLACDPTTFGPAPSPADAGPLPDPSIRPRPLEDPRIDGGTAAQQSADAGDAGTAPPEPLEVDDALEPDVLIEESGGIELEVAIRWRDQAGPPGLPEVDTKAVTRLREVADGTLQVALAAAGRARIEVASRAMTLPEGTALLGRAERYGHVLVWPGGRRYRVIPVGAARALFGEARADVGQVVRGSPTSLEAGERLGIPTRRVRLTSPLGTVVLEMAEVAAAGAAAGLFCRLLLDIAGIDPASEVCARGEIALAADYRWHRGGPGVSFEAVRIVTREEMPRHELAMPPRRARFSIVGLPDRPAVFFAADELTALRTVAIDVGPSSEGAPETGLEAINRSDLGLFLLIDGVATAYVAPWQALVVGGLRPGRYVLQWRSFLGDVVEPPTEQVVPGRVVYGEPLPAATPDAG